MHPDVQSLLAVQVDDLAMYALEDRLGSLAPRLAALEKERGLVAKQLERARVAIVAEESRLREAMGRVETHRALVERSQRAYESVTSPKEANAAVTQLEQTKRMVEDSERDAAQVQGRINELRHSVADQEKALADVEAKQSDARVELEADRAKILEEIAALVVVRANAASVVPRALITTYDRVRARRRGDSLYPLRAQSCSACDTAIPTQRRAQMASTGAVEMCEGCGVLLYAGE